MRVFEVIETQQYDYGEMRRRLTERDDGGLRRHWGGVLQIARLRS